MVYGLLSLLLLAAASLVALLRGMRSASRASRPVPLHATQMAAVGDEPKPRGFWQGLAQPRSHYEMTEMMGGVPWNSIR